MEGQVIGRVGVNRVKLPDGESRGCIIASQPEGEVSVRVCTEPREEVLGKCAPRGVGNGRFRREREAQDPTVSRRRESETARPIG